MKHFALYLGLAAAMMASCSIQEEDFKAPEQDNVIFYATFEQPSEGTRVYANDNLYLRWTADDRVSIFNKYTYNQQYKFLGETGDNSGEFNRLDAAEFVTGNPIPHVVSVYPYQEGTSISEDEVLSLKLPTEQHYAEDSFGLGANTMVSVSEDNVLLYKNVGGYLVIKLYGEGMSVSSITLKGNNGEKLAGNASVAMLVDGYPSVEMASDATTEITLICETPAQLGANAEESTEFWFVVPPVTFDKGFTVSITKTSGSVFEKSTSRSVTIERNHLYKMSPIEAEGGAPIAPIPEAVDLGLPSGLKWASFNVGASKPEDAGDYYAWAEIEPYYSSLDPLTWKEGKEDGYWYTSYKWLNENLELTKYFTDGKMVPDPDDDVAHVIYGDKWRMPTDAEWTELRENCTWTWTMQGDIRGYLVTASNDNSIFIPAVGAWYMTDLQAVGTYGYYWSANLDTNHLGGAWLVGFGSGFVGRSSTDSAIWYGLSIRPVYGDPAPDTIETPVPEAVDLGLPSGLKWASFNLGASKPEDYGDYYAWGEIEPYYSSQDPLTWKEGKEAGYNWESYNWCIGSRRTMTKYCSNSEYGYNGFTDTKTVLDSEDDAARVHLGGGWRMPISSEWTELREKCTWTLTMQKGIKGYLVSARNGNSFFLPAAGFRDETGLIDMGSLGYFFSSSLDTNTPNDAWGVYFNSEYVDIYNFGRSYGLSIRPVCD